MRPHGPPLAAIARPSRRLPYLSAALFLATLATCAPRGARVQMPASLPAAFTSTGDTAAPVKWWTAFGDPRLDELVGQALTGNFTLRMAWDRLRQAHAVAAKAGAALWPGLEGTAGAGWGAEKAESTPRTDGADFSLGLAVSYEIDLWGRVRSTRDAARLDAYATQQDLQAAAISLAAQVAATWYGLVEQRGQLRLLDEQLETNEKYLEVITLKFRRGQVSAADVLQQRQLVEQTRGERLLVQSAIEVLDHELAVLMGRAPGEKAGGALPAAASLPELPPLPATGVPAQWVRRRPDVRAAELRVQSADRRVAAAIADQFPRLGLSIEAGTSAEQIQSLFSNWMASLAANLLAPLFEGGERRAEVERTRAAASEQLNAYAELVLESLKEVEDALAQEGKQRAYLTSLEQQLSLAQEATEQTLDSYTKGATDFTRYLTTLLDYQQLQRSDLQARRDLVLFRIDLYRALAGSWRLDPPPPAEVTGPTEAVDDPAADTNHTTPADTVAPEGS